jgi:hypothetical protein
MFFLKRSLVWQLVGNPVYSRDSTSNSLVLLSPIFAWPLLQPTMFFLKRSLIWSGWCSCLFRGFYFKQSGTFICISPCSNDVLPKTVPRMPPMSWYPVNKLTHIYIYIYTFVLKLLSLYIDHSSTLVVYKQLFTQMVITHYNLETIRRKKRNSIISYDNEDNPTETPALVLFPPPLSRAPRSALLREPVTHGFQWLLKTMKRCYASSDRDIPRYNVCT